jgi:hypothetical protein
MSSHEIKVGDTLVLYWVVVIFCNGPSYLFMLRYRDTLVLIWFISKFKTYTNYDPKCQIDSQTFLTNFSHLNLNRLHHDSSFVELHHHTIMKSCCVPVPPREDSSSFLHLPSFYPRVPASGPCQNLTSTNIKIKNVTPLSFYHTPSLPSHPFNWPAITHWLATTYVAP